MLHVIARSVATRQSLSCVILALVAGLFLTACGDFHGPWEYYPNEREIYTGIYTYGYVQAKGSTNICFSKVYELDEAASPTFAFYDSARVTVKGRFDNQGNTVDTTLALVPASARPNCFEGTLEGISGESYTMNAYFEWDSAGHSAKTTYTAEAKVPKPVKVKGVNMPQQDGSYKWSEYKGYKDENDTTPMRVKYLEFPMDMEFFKVALDYDKSIGGVLILLTYNIDDDEPLNTTLNNMFKGFAKKDSMGYRGISVHDPLENTVKGGYSENSTIAGIHMLDTLYGTGMMLPLGEFYMDFYSTDSAYIDYVDKVKASEEDSRIIPESNIENGMGVFTGIAKTRVNIFVEGDGVALRHVAYRNCTDKSGDNSDGWDSKACRLYQDVFCAGIEKWDDLQSANASAYRYYADSVPHYGMETCYASQVKAAMMLDTTSWSVFLPDTLNSEDKSEAYGDGLKRYCVANNFKSNKIADCSALKKQCMESPDKNDCKEYLWLWCADRNWQLDTYEQCRSALVSRYYIEEQKSPVLAREVELICRQDKPAICKNW